MSETETPTLEDAYGMVDEIDCSGAYINSAEQDFLEDMITVADAKTGMTGPQRDWIQRIWNRVCG